MQPNILTKFIRQELQGGKKYKVKVIVIKMDKLLN
jgi:hypothetical protein